MTMSETRGWGLLEGLLDITKDGAGNASPNNEEDPKGDLETQYLLRKIIRKGLIENKNDVEIQRRNPNSPLYSIKTFEALNLPANLLKGLYDMGYDSPSKIQETALPTLMAYPPQNMIAQSQSGTGKTAAFVLAMLSRVDPDKKYPQSLCLSPTYELALQTAAVTKKMAKYCRDLQIKLAVRGENMAAGENIEEQVIIGTPGKVLDWCLKYGVLDLKRLEVFVLDEADIMISQQGHQDQSMRIHKTLPDTCQRMLFSATYDEEIMEFADAIIKQTPLILRLKREEECLTNIKQLYVACPTPDEKYRAIANIYGVVTIGQALIFCRTRRTAAWLAAKMSIDGHAVALLTGELTTEQRAAVIERYREGLEKVLITTNVLSRGIDVEQTTLVVNYDLPVDKIGRASCETYLHRIGRTGRFGKAGLAINLVEDDHSINVLRQIENHFGRKIVKLDSDNVDELEKLFQDY